ncbi:MAG: tRNA pseudouridine(55) synthase TruB, partial [Solobacterium sp.]|nr:tRNA pseudouridine(55) synthase TruB [Solobacterium sp.]
MDAVLLINKPTGMTSFSVVSQCRKAFHEKKAGHTGTLDPNASGLMIVLLGRCTKLAPYCASG